MDRPADTLLDPALLPDFERLARLRDSSYATDMLIAAVGWLDFFTVLAEAPLDFTALRQRFGLAARPCDVMLTLFKAWRLVQERDGRFATTPVADAFLVATCPGNLVDYIASLKRRSAVKDMLEVLRTGSSQAWEREQAAEKTEWQALMTTDAFAASYTAAMDNRGMRFAAALARILDCSGRRRVLDVAGGSGVYTTSLLSCNPGLTAGIFERPPVDAMAARYVAARGFGSRVAIHGGDMFVDPLPDGYDLHLYCHVLHNWGVEKVRQLLAKSFAALAPGGGIAILSVHVNAAKDGPASAAEYSTLLASLFEGQCYSEEEMRRELETAGYRNVTVIPSIASRSLIQARKP